jgi:hypothetical protein
VIDHLGSCPSCTLQYEELAELVGNLRHARSAVRPLHSFDVGKLPIMKRRRRTRPLRVAAAIVAAWAVLLTTALVWPALGARLAFLRIGPEATAVSPAGSDYGQQAPSLSRVPAAALVEALRSLSSGTGLASGSHDDQGLLSSERVSVRVTRLGPVVSQSAGFVELRATVEVSEAPNVAAGLQHLQVVMTLSKRSDGSWAVTRVVADPR